MARDGSPAPFGEGFAPLPNPEFRVRTGRSTVTLMLRLVAEAAAEGEVVGHAEVVDTGELATIDGTADLLDLLRRL